jgi:hypothetical protein
MDATRDVVYTVHEARKGVAWLKDAWALFSRARMPWLFLLATYYVVMMAVDLVPFVGQLAVPLIKPVSRSASSPPHGRRSAAARRASPTCSRASGRTCARCSCSAPSSSRGSPSR